MKSSNSTYHSENEMITAASPQIENGYFPIATEIAEALMRTNLSAYQSRILWAIWRKTYGWNKAEDYMSTSQLTNITGLRKQHVSRTLKELHERNIVTRSGYNATNRGYKIGFQKDYTRWRQLPKEVTVTSRGYDRNRSRNHNIQNIKNNNSSCSDSPVGISKQKDFSFTEDDMRLSKLLNALLTENNPERKPTQEVQLKSWANQVRLMREKDHRSPEGIEEIIRWCQSDSFWHTNILSMEKLRKRFDALTIKMRPKDRRLDVGEKFNDSIRPEHEII